MSYTMMPKPKKPLKDPNAKSPIQKFFGGKIPHYLAVFAFLFSSYNLFSFQMVKMRFPDTTGLVLPKYLKKANGKTSK